MTLWQPVPQARWRQQLLLAITRDEVLRHPEMVLNPPDSSPFTQQPPCKPAVSDGRRTCSANRLRSRVDFRACHARHGGGTSRLPEMRGRIELVSNHRHKRPANADLLMGDTGLEPVTSALSRRRSPS